MSGVLFAPVFVDVSEDGGETDVPFEVVSVVADAPNAASDVVSAATPTSAPTVDVAVARRTPRRARSRRSIRSSRLPAFMTTRLHGADGRILNRSWHFAVNGCSREALQASSSREDGLR